LDVYQSEDEQVEALRKWWNENGKSVVTGIILGLGAIFGWRAWQDHTRLQTEAASELYQQIIVAMGTDENTGEVEQVAAELINNYGTTTYSVFAKLALARLAVEESDYTSATDHLRWALDNNKEKIIEPLIRLRLARVLATRKDYNGALSLLDEGDAGKYAASFDELRGDIRKITGDIEGARSAYQQAVAINREMENDATLLEIKLDDLGRVELQ